MVSTRTMLGVTTIAFLVGLALLVGGVFSDPADGARNLRPRVAVKVVNGPSIEVPPFTVTGLGAYDLACPSGYRLTGIGVAPGANQIVYADPNYDGRTASFSFANDSDLMAFSASGSITCVRGERGLTVRAAAADMTHSDRIAEARAALKQ